MKEINVYVIENEQPFENWFGTWRGFQTIDDISGYYVQNNKEELIKVNEKNVFEVDSTLQIFEYLKLKSEKDTLIKFGLSIEDTNLFINLLNKMVIPKDEQESFDAEMEEGIPFEGGICFNEALTGLLIDR